MQKNKGYIPPNRSGKILVTINTIADYYGRDAKTVKHLIKTDNFPAIFECGRWISYADLVDDYTKRKISNRAGCTGPAVQEAP